jgi:hypothetical protein
MSRFICCFAQWHSTVCRSEECRGTDMGVEQVYREFFQQKGKTEQRPTKYKHRTKLK